MKRYLLAIIYLTLITLAVCFGYNYIYDMKTPKFSFHEQASNVIFKDYSPTEICGIDLKNDGKIDFIILTQNQLNPSSKSPIYVYKNNGQNFWVAEKNEAISFYHPRNCATGDFNGDGYPDLIVADHGPDIPPYPGGYPRILFSDSAGNLTAAPDNFFKTNRLFNFNVVVADFNSDNKDDILLINAGDSSSALFLNQNYQSMADRSDLLPDFLVKKQKKFLGALATDLNLDQHPDVLLGGHGGPGKSESFERDVVLFGTENKLTEELPDFFPPRTGFDKLSSVEIVSANLNGDPYPDVVVLYHTVGFMSDGHVDFYINVKGTHLKKIPVFNNYKKDPNINWWFARGVALNQNGLDEQDFVVLPRATNPYGATQVPAALYYKNFLNGMLYVDSVFKNFNKSIVGVLKYDLNNDKIDDLIFVGYDGSVTSAIKIKN